MPHPTDHTIKTRLLLRPVRCPFGTIRLGGINQGGFGVGISAGAMRVRPYYSLNYILSGEGLYRDANGLEKSVPAESAVIFFPRFAQACGTPAGRFWDEFWFEFEGPVFDLMRKTHILDPHRPVHHAPGREHWFRRLFTIIPPVHLRHRTEPHVIVARFAALLTDLVAGQHGAIEPAPADDWLGKACHLLDVDPQAEESLVSIARRLGVSYESFRKKFRKEMGFSPGQFRMDARIDRAAALLYQGRHSVKEIAEQLGFCDEFYFSRCFKRRFGKSPRAFRLSVRGP